MLWADNRSIAMQIVFPEKACKKPIFFSHFYFFKRVFRHFWFSFYESCCVAECDPVAAGVESAKGPPSLIPEFSVED